MASQIRGLLQQLLKPLTCGVPQGSTIGPLLFLIYFNDLPYVSNLRTRLFTDDTISGFNNVRKLSKHCMV